MPPDMPNGDPNDQVGAGRSPYGPDEASPFQADRTKPLVNRVFPVTEALPRYRERSLRRALIAGVTVAALALPSAMAYAQLAGLSPVAGLYGLLLPVVSYVFFGSSRQLIVGPEGALSVMVAVAVAPLAGGDPSLYAALAAILAMLVGGIYLAAWAIRLGWVADYFSAAVLVGYLHGIAVVLIIGQLAKLTGVSTPAEDPLGQLWQFLTHAAEGSGTRLLVGRVCVARWW